MHQNTDSSVGPGKRRENRAISVALMVGAIYTRIIVDTCGILVGYVIFLVNNVWF